MGLLQRAVETYDAAAGLAGVIRADHETLAPIGHTLTSANLEITLDAQGAFLSARRVDKSEKKILIPVTEESGGRTRAPAAHPLCDQLKYVAPQWEKEHDLYLTGLQHWASSEHSHPFLSAIYAYVSQGTVLTDLLKSGVITLDAKGKYDEKQLVCWRVEGVPEQEPACWRNRALMDAFAAYYLARISVREPMLCMIEGKVTAVAEQHPKGIIPVNGNAKLISANDTTGFTYRGRFTTDVQAATVSYAASQKAHNALRWLAAEQGVRDFVGNRVFLCWNPQGKQLMKPIGRVRGSDAPPKYQPSDYRSALNSTLMSFRKDRQIQGTETAVLAAFDAATTGRLAVTYYQELSLDLFFSRMQNWDAHCCWYLGKFGIQAPNLLQIVDCAFGTQRGNFLETEDKVKGQHVQRLLNCKISGGVFPQDVMQMLIQRASSPLGYDEGIWRRILKTACAAIQKYRFDTNQGGNEMEWELDKRDRSFQFGRLLAVMERAEEDFYSRTQEARQTNAIKNLPEYRQRPLYVFERVNRMLQQAYLPRIEPWQRDRYARLTGEIFAILREFPEDTMNRRLNENYLLGYELQRNAFFTKKETVKTEE